MPHSCSTCSREGTWSQLMRCSRCKTTVYCSSACQSSDWPAHRSRCVPASPPGMDSPPSPSAVRLPPSRDVVGVTIACNADRERGVRALAPTIIPPSHPIYDTGLASPIFQHVGLPLLIHRHMAADPANMHRSPGLDNQAATHLLTHPSTGAPDPKWRRAGCMGTVTVIRQDGQPLTMEAMETLLIYVDHILDLFQDGVSPSRQLSPAGFQRFCHRYRDERIKGGYKNFSVMQVPL